MENLGRGVVAVRNPDDSVFVSWRLLGYEPQDLPFNLYRASNGGAAQKLNDEPLAAGTNFTDTTADPTVENAYFVRPVIDGMELPASADYTLPANATARPYLSMPLEPTPWDTYVHMVWVGDLNGDGEYDYVVNRIPSVTGQPRLLDAYLSDGTFLWRMNFGPNSVDPDNIEPPPATINAGHNDGVTVYDLDGDGTSEVVVITANGVTYGDGETFSYGDDITQFVSVLDGMTGAVEARDQVPTDYIEDGPVAGHFGVAYLDGEHPSFVFKAKNRIGSGAFNVMVTTWDFDGTDLTQRWKFAPGSEVDYPNFHQIRIVDVDRDGRDEICDGGYVLDDDGTVLYNLKSAGVVHGDRFHIGDLDPTRPGLEGFGIQQNNGSGLLYYIYDAATGEMIHQHFGGIEDTGRGTAADIDAAYLGYEYWSFHGIHEIQTGSVISPDPRRPWPNFRIWWDGDVMSENLNREIVEKWNPATQETDRLLTASEDGAVDAWRDAAQFYGDILGDWREEVIYENADRSELMIYTTPTPSDVRLYTLPHNPEYRACFTVKGYLQSNMIDYYLGDGMTAPPAPDIVPVLAADADTPAITSFTDDAGHSDRDHLTNDATPMVSGLAPAGSTVVVSRAGLGDDGTAVADSSGHWSYAYTNPLADGEYHLLARLDDGQDRYSSPFAIEIETVAPDQPAVEAIAASAVDSFTVIGQAEPNARVEVQISGLGVIGSAMADETGNWTLEYTGTALTGNYTVSAVAEDVAGNLSDAAEKAVDFTMALPTFAGIEEDTGTDASDGITTDGTLTFSGTAEPNAEVAIVQIGAGRVGTVTADGSGAWTFDYSGQELEAGSYAFTAVNSGGVGSQLFQVTVDQSVPSVASIELISPEEDTSSATAAIFRVTFSEAVSGVDAADFGLMLGDTLNGNIAAVDAVDGRTYDVTVDPLSGAGSLQLAVNATGTGIADLAGNALSEGFSDGAVFNRVLLGDGVWTRNSTDGNWSDNSNWEGDIVADGVDHTADFSTLDIADDITVVLDASRSIGHLVFGDQDAESAAGWQLDADGGSELTLLGDLDRTSITVDSLAEGRTATINAPLAGNQGFAKRGSGKLILTAESSISGTIAVDEGELEVASTASLHPGEIQANGGHIFRIAGGEVVSSGTAEINDAGRLIIDGGLASFDRIYGSNNSGNRVHLNGGMLIADTVEFRRSTASGLDYDTGLVVRGGEAQIGDIIMGTANSNGMMSVEGGVVSVSGPITLGWQSTGGRGGHLRVTGGAFYSTDLVDGLVLVRALNNAASANFLGGVSMINKISLGYDATLLEGTATVTVDGGTLYIGPGGIVKNAGGDFEASVSFDRGTVGAWTSWYTTFPIQLGGDDNITLQAANSMGVAQDIVLSGQLSGTGGLTKTGAGRLFLGGQNTFTGAVVVQGGELVANGQIASGSGVTVADGGRLSGAGSIQRTVALQSGGVLAPGAATPGATLGVDGLEWQSGGVLELGQDHLSINGALTKTGEGTYVVRIDGDSALQPGHSYTLVSFDSTDFTVGDFTLQSANSGFDGVLALDGDSLVLTVNAMPTSYARYAAATFPAGAAHTGPNDDYNGDGISNFMAFAFAVDPITGAGREHLPQVTSVSSEDGAMALEIVYTRPQDVAVDYRYQGSTNMTSWSDLAVDGEPDGVSITDVADNGDGTEQVTAQITHADETTYFARVLAE